VAARGGQLPLFAATNRETSSLHESLASASGPVARDLVAALPIDVLLAEIGINNVGLLKIDIEREEVALLAAAPYMLLRRVAQMSVEFHAFLPGGCPRKEVEALIDRLRRLGFLSLVSSLPIGNHKDTLFINRHLVKLRARERLHLWLLRHITLPAQKRVNAFAAWLGLGEGRTGSET
jgi:hypothetical protein